MVTTRCQASAQQDRGASTAVVSVREHLSKEVTASKDTVTGHNGHLTTNKRHQQCSKVHARSNDNNADKHDPELITTNKQP